MSLSQPAQQHVCLPCLLQLARRRSTSTASRLTVRLVAVPLDEPEFRTDIPRSLTSRRVRLKSSLSSCLHSQTRRFSTSQQWPANTVPSDSDRLSATQLQAASRVQSLKDKLARGLAQLPKQSADANGVPVETLLGSISKDGAAKSTDKSIALTVEQVFAGRSSSDVTNELAKVKIRRVSGKVKTISQEGKTVLVKLGIAEDDEQDSKTKSGVRPHSSQPKKLGDNTSGRRKRARNMSKAAQRKVKAKAPQGKVRKVASRGKLQRRATRKGSKQSADEDVDEDEVVTWKPSDLKKIQSLDTIDSTLLKHESVETNAVQRIPRLSFDLSRVLFNPGVYQLQDPRSRVFNFDPYLQHLIPIEQFNFEALNKYLTSSEDSTLRDLATKHQKKYIGSSSSMTGVLSHFHFLLSAWRPLEINALSRHFQDQAKNFTQITRGPSAIFLRWKNGSYAVDADKEFDSSNVLMNMGKALEKLLTLEKHDFERYRRSPTQISAELLDTEPEAFHYSELDDFLMRSQLDAYDPRLPGTGTFDLKTRAVAGVRMNIGEYEVGKGYQIKDRVGTWESYEREYFDMMRSAFLKYSLQVRMGRMDGIFVAYHNVARMFGFQYIPVPEMDTVLHGQADPTLGDREFRSSLRLLNEIFNMATKEFPEQSIRFHIETRPESKGDPNGYMLIFAESMTEDEIQTIQDSGKEKAAEMERKLLYPDSEPSEAIKAESAQLSPSSSSSSPLLESNGSGLETEAAEPTNIQSQPSNSSLSSTRESTDADVAFLDHISSNEVEDKAAQRSMIAWKLRVYNEVNGRVVTRPQNLQESDQWTVRYQFSRIADDSAWIKYRACKNRRKATLEWPDERPDTYFLRQIRQLNEKGAAWRREQDEIEAGQEKVMLYSNATG